MSLNSKKYVKKNNKVTQKHKKNYKTHKYVKSIGNLTRKYLFKNSVGGQIILKPLKPSYIIKVNEKLKKLNQSASESFKKRSKKSKKSQYSQYSPISPIDDFLMGLNNDEKEELVNKIC